MMNQFPLLAGAVVGFSVAMPVGPMGLLCIQRTLTTGMLAGISTGLGAATVNVAYGAVILLGLDELTPLVAGCGRMLGAMSGLFLLFSAARTLLRQGPVDTNLGTVAPSPLASYGSAVVFNATNPMSVVLMMALLSPVAIPSAPPLPVAAAMLLGVFLAAATWWVCLSAGVALLRSRLSPAMLVLVNRAAGLGLTVNGLLVLARSAGIN